MTVHWIQKKQVKTFVYYYTEYISAKENLVFFVCVCVFFFFFF